MVLTGGLGNQMFQLAAGLSLAMGDELFLETKLCKPRLGKAGLPEVLELELPQEIKLINRQYNVFISKILGFNIRMTVKSRKIENIKLIKYFVKIMSSFFLSIYFKKIFLLINENELNQYKILQSKMNVLYLGYFQTLTFVSHKRVNDLLFNLKPKENNKILNSLEVKSQSKKILIMHVRLGDYRNEPEFGLLSTGYYREALNAINRCKKIDEIWLFSNEIRQALLYIPENFRSKVVFIEEGLNSSVEILYAMRLGSNYVIANSSLSWWGAYTTFAKSPQIFAPTPWFKMRNDVENFIPLNWSRISGYNEYE